MSKHINVLRKLKYQICRNNLEKLYLAYIRPLFEYACEVWDNCGVLNANKLEKLQLEAARIITGLPVFTNTELIYKELGWETLANRRQRRKLQLFFNIQHNSAPEYLSKLIPPNIQSTTIYPLRNGEDIIVPFCRLTLTSESYIPSTIKKWNNLNPTIRNIESISKFKRELKRANAPDIPVPKYYSYGPRKLNIILTQIRCCASFLNYDLHKVNIVSNPFCHCGSDIENAYHYFFECNTYTNIRLNLFLNLNWLPADCLIDLQLLTCGCSELTEEQNELIFKYVFEFIKKTKRFLIV